MILHYSFIIISRFVWPDLSITDLNCFLAECFIQSITYDFGLKYLDFCIYRAVNNIIVLFAYNILNWFLAKCFIQSITYDFKLKYLDFYIYRTINNVIILFVQGTIHLKVKIHASVQYHRRLFLYFNKFYLENFFMNNNGIEISYLGFNLYKNVI